VPLTMNMAEGVGFGAMVKIVRSCERFSAETIGGVGIFSAVGLRDAGLEQTIHTVIKSHTLSGVKSVRRDAHETTETCILHAPGACLSSAYCATQTRENTITWLN
jgi:protein-L-isoaspartate(D-aspartate) O-methyltransferase